MLRPENFFSLTAALLVLSACSRPMTVGEISYSEGIFSTGVTFEDARFSGQETRGMRLAERQLALEASQELNAREDVDKLISSLPSLFGAAAFVIGNTVYFDREYYRSDFSTSPFAPDRWLMAHELTHVWQWQNRDATGYTFSKVISEHRDYGDDVYDYTLVDGKRFTEYRFEQQGRIVQCYAQLRQVQPNAATTARHEKLIRAEFPLSALMELIGPDNDGVVRVRQEQDRIACDGA